MGLNENTQPSAAPTICRGVWMLPRTCGNGCMFGKRPLSAPGRSDCQTVDANRITKHTDPGMGSPVHPKQSVIFIIIMTHMG